MQIIAHPDDDLFFMNPDISVSIANKCPVVGIVMTAAEGDGRNIDTSRPDRLAQPPDYYGYSRARRNGLCGAYARMATGDRRSPWQRETVTLEGGFEIEQNVLRAQPRIRLYFLNLGRHPAGNETSPHPSTLLKLWTGQAVRMPTVIHPGSPVSGSSQMTREQVLAALVDLLGRFHPTVLRGMDPDPEHDHGKSQYTTSDHEDHTAAAQFALEASRRHTAASGERPVMEFYRAYANRYWPYNLSTQAHAEKRKYLLTYAAADGVADPELNGDRQVGDEPDRSTHIFTTAYRYTPSTNWLTRRADGSLCAFAVLGSDLACWEETEPASGRWSGPAVVDDGGLLPSIGDCGDM